LLLKFLYTIFISVKISMNASLQASRLNFTLYDLKLPTNRPLNRPSRKTHRYLLVKKEIIIISMFLIFELLSLVGKKIPMRKSMICGIKSQLSMVKLVFGLNFESKLTCSPVICDFISTQEIITGQTTHRIIIIGNFSTLYSPL
jgi:hypothetical protein